MSFSNFSNASFNIFFIFRLAICLFEGLYAFSLLFGLLFKFNNCVFLVVLSLKIGFFLDLLLKLKLLQEVFMSHEDAVRVAYSKFDFLRLTYGLS